MSSGCVKGPDGAKYWHNGVALHREDGPAIVTTLYEKWYIHGKLHREDGPAIRRADGYCEWWLNDKWYLDINSYCRAVKMTAEETTFFLLKWQT